jgi:hypothetical protein
VLIWNAIDLERKLEEFRNYYNENRVHQSLSGRTPGERSGEPPPAHAVLVHYAWRHHCRGLYCYRLAYTSQQESARDRGLWKSQKIRIRLGGSAGMLDDFPDKPKGMHRQTYDRLCRVHDAAEERSIIGLMHFVERLGRRSSRRARS